MVKTLFFILLLCCSGCATTMSATAYRNYLIDAAFVGAISYEEYKRQMTPELLMNVAIEQDRGW